MQERYDPQSVEREAQAFWESRGSFRVVEEPAKPKFYCLSMFPYPSGKLHMGHVRNYTIGDVLTRTYRMRGYNVLQPMGWDAFGLPAENAAMANKVPPAKWTYDNIAYMKKQLKSLGFALDWQRELATCRPEYYKWNQWLFTRLFKKGLAYKKTGVVNWDPVDQTVLANEQVIDGRGWRTGAPVEKREIPMYFLRITAYAEELLAALDGLPGWPEQVKRMQKNWIGRSEGVRLAFPYRLDGAQRLLWVFTTRADTLMGATFCAVAAEHPIATHAARGNPALTAFVEECKRGAVMEADLAQLEKKGMATGLTCTHPLSGEQVPVWVANYVLMGYGEGAVMAVPAHDERDYAFALKYGLPIKPVIRHPLGDGVPEPWKAEYASYGTCIHSGKYDGLDFKAAVDAIAADLSARGLGGKQVQWRLRDWGISRQRYWGCPIPIVYCDEHGAVPVPESELPVLLPEIDDYKPKGIAPLASAEDWVRTPCPVCGKEGRREVETMDTFVDSSWYFLRFCDPHNDDAAWDRGIVDWWNPVDQYIGGVDHATMHLIYARFFMKALNDLGLIGFREPFSNLFTNGWVQLGGSKMSKSKGNVIGPEELVAEYGADSARLYMLFIGPAREDMDWTDDGIDGMSRFVRRVYRLVGEVAERAPHGEPPPGELTRKAHETIAKVTDDVGRRQSFNTAIAAVMELVNELSKAGPDDPAARFAAETAVSLLQPYAPHVAEELWERLGHERLWEQPWPEADPSQLVRDTFELVVQVNGKVRDRFEVDVGASEDELIARAKASARVQSHLDGAQVRKTIVVPRKLVNFVVG